VPDLKSTGKNGPVFEHLLLVDDLGIYSIEAPTPKPDAGPTLPKGESQ
jgi:hypothetical protein